MENTQNSTIKPEKHDNDRYVKTLYNTDGMGTIVWQTQIIIKDGFVWSIIDKKPA
ncbi:MAG: hypothetical protein J6Y89_08685 [Lachnospiraceae bacterium]|nr:hypothetical protein [Lachnospiraceae bacterium]